MHRHSDQLAAIVFLLLSTLILAGEPDGAAEAAPKPDSEKTLTVEEIVKLVRPSLVTISTTGREAREQGVGTGFVVSSEGLIATNLHVIGEGREFTVELSDGTDLKVLSVHASDRHRDLAIVKVDPQDKQLAALEFGEAGELKQGAPVVVMGNPLGLKHSVVSGVVSAIREIDGQEMLQLAIPIERGNSGGPVVDRQGRVHGIVNMKSLREENVGFAVEAKHVKPLLEKPNSISLARWATIGAIDGDQWTPLMGARWRQRGGKILVAGVGSGFGGRSLCISKQAPPELPFEVAVRVKLDDESGAAGLIFHSDGSDKNYGFYPTNGKLRLTCFQGPTVFTWKILQDINTEHYRAGEWNDLKVRISEDKLECFVNGELVVESRDKTYTSGRIGLAKFRHTEAEFKHFQVAKEIALPRLTSDEAAGFSKLIDELPDLTSIRTADLDSFVGKAGNSTDLFLRKADELEQRAEQLRKTATDVHVLGVTKELGDLVGAEDGDFDLLRGGLLLATLDERDIDIEAYIAHVDRMAREIQDSLDDEADEAAKLVALGKYLFVENGFHGSRSEYYHRANSYLNRVIDDREGIPVTLSVLYMELGRRLDLDIQGVGLPRHFVVKHVPSEGEEQLIDVFEGARMFSREEAAGLVKATYDRELADADLAGAPKKQILTRMLRNLLGLAESRSDTEGMLRYVEALVALEPDVPEYRGQRASLRAYGERHAAAIADLDWLLEHEPPGIDLQRIHSMRKALMQRLK
jgi:S1-C subfamily serine protease/regulator of sirC expression with transglutaminase-like and TPR domain